MNMNLPPIDELEQKMGSKYKLSCVLSKRAKELEKRIPDEIEKSDKKAITMAAEEIMAGKIVSSDENL